MMSGQRLVDPTFWKLPLDERMAELIPMRAGGPFVQATFENIFTGEAEEFTAVLGHAELVEISRHPEDFCSGKGATALVDFPTEMLDFFGGFINMDDPRHARQRGIVSRAFTPKSLAAVLDSVETICTEVVDGFCEQGEVDLVAALSQPFPLLVICDMMGIPRGEFRTVLDATNIILSGGDPEFMGDGDPVAALIGAGLQLAQLMNDLGAERRKHPTDDLTSKLVNAEGDDDVLVESELASFFILLAVAGNDTTRTAISHGVSLLDRNRDQKQIWLDDIDGVTPTAVDEIVRVAAPVTFMRRTATRDITMAGHHFREGDKVALLYGAASRDPRVFADPERFDVCRDPNPHVGFGGPGPHFCLGAHLARREIAVAFRQLLTRLPDLELAGDPVPLDVQGIPLVAGIKRLPVRFTPATRVGL
jgi:cytochrome P450